MQYSGGIKRSMSNACEYARAKCTHRDTSVEGAGDESRDRTSTEKRDGRAHNHKRRAPLGVAPAGAYDDLALLRYGYCEVVLMNW